jgi:hypothetical protein
MTVAPRAVTLPSAAPLFGDDEDAAALGGHVEPFDALEHQSGHGDHGVGFDARLEGVGGLRMDILQSSRIHEDEACSFIALVKELDELQNGVSVQGAPGLNVQVAPAFPAMNLER